MNSQNDKLIDVSKKWLDFLLQKAPWIMVVASVISIAAISVAIFDVRNGFTTCLGISMIVIGIIVLSISLVSLVVVSANEKAILK